MGSKAAATTTATTPTAVTEANLDSDRESHPFLRYYAQLSHQQNVGLRCAQIFAS